MSSKKELTNGKYVDDQMGNGIPEGGTTGQVLKKNSSTDYDVVWGAGGGSGGSVAWGDITGSVIDQTDLTSYLSGAYYPLSTNPANYLTSSSITGMVTGSGAATRLAFWNGSSSISSDSALNWDNISKRLCIGGMPSGYTLEVIGTGYFNSDVLIGNQSKLKFSVNNIYIRPEIVSSAYKDLAFYTNTTERLRILDNGTIKIDNLSGSGTRMVVSDSTGLLSTQTIPTIPTVGTWGALNYPTWTTGTPFVKMTAAGTFSLDTNTYLTANQSITLSGDVSGSGATSITTAIGNNKVTNAMLAQVATSTFKGRITTSTGNVEDLTGTQATSLLDTFTSSLKGLAPASGGGTTNFLRADGTWAAPPGGGGSAASPTGSVQFNDSGSFGGDSNFTWDNVNKYLGIGTSTPSVKLDVKGNTKIISDGVFNIGTSYKGGIVAYILEPGDSGYDPEYIKGFIATASDLSAGIQWYNGSYIITGANDPSIGIGSSNTSTIVSYQGPTYADYAAGLALDDYTEGYTDWYLPSKDELNKLYLNRVAIGGFSSSIYWSSTEALNPTDDVNAWSQDFNTGSQAEADKSSIYRVRAIRNFSFVKTKFNLSDTAIGLHSRIGIGIGTDNPQAPLDIAGDAGATGGAGGPRFLLYGTGGSPQYLSGLGVDLGQAGSSFGFFAGNQAAFTVEQATVFENFPYPSGYTTRFAIIPGGNIGIGTVFPVAKLDVFNDSGPVVANFSGINGYPIQILTTNTPMSAGSGYVAPIGSIGNGAGILSLKTGSADVDWAPIVYERGPMPERTFTGIDLTSAYYITSPGIYEVTTASGDKMYFPNPTPLDGQRITIVNTDTGTDITINSDSYAPYERGNSSQLSVIGIGNIWQFVSIGGKWRGMRG